MIPNTRAASGEHKCGIRKGRPVPRNRRGVEQCTQGRTDKQRMVPHSLCLAVPEWL